MTFGGMNGKLLQKIYFLENTKKTCKPNNYDLTRDWNILKNVKKKQIRLFKWGYMINGNENDTENEKNRSRRCNINRSRPRYGRKFSIFSII